MTTNDKQDLISQDNEERLDRIEHEATGLRRVSDGEVRARFAELLERQSAAIVRIEAALH